MATPMEKNVKFSRIRLVFDDICPVKVKKCWFLFDRLKDHTIDNVLSSIKERNGLPQSFILGITLDGFSLPSNESSCIIHDDDILSIYKVDVAPNSKIDSNSILCGSCTRTPSSSIDQSANKSLKRIARKRANDDEVSLTIKGKKRKINDVDQELSKKKKKKKKKCKSSPVILLQAQKTPKNSNKVQNKQISDEKSSHYRKRKAKKKSSISENKTSAIRHSVQGQSPEIATLPDSIKDPDSINTKETQGNNKDVPSSESSSESSSDETIPQPRRTGFDPEDERKLQEYIDNLPVVKRQRRGGRNRNRRSKNRPLNTTDASTLIDHSWTYPQSTSTPNEVAFVNSFDAKQLTERVDTRSVVAVLNDVCNDNSANGSISEHLSEPNGDINIHGNAVRRQSRKRKGRQTAVDSNLPLSLNQEKEPGVSPEPLPDYSAMPVLVGSPRVGDRIAFKVMELSSNYEPFISDYKVGDVVSVTTTVVELKLSLGHQERNRFGRFEMSTSRDEEEGDHTVNYELITLMDTRLVTQPDQESATDARHEQETTAISQPEKTFFQSEKETTTLVQPVKETLLFVQPEKETATFVQHEKNTTGNSDPGKEFRTGGQHEQETT